MEKKLKKVYNQIEPLQCLHPMVWYYQYIYKSIRHLVGDENHKNEDSFARMPPEQVREFRRYINSDLHNLSLEFYLQRVAWAKSCKKQKGQETHQLKAARYPAKHPCQMKGGFKLIEERDEKAYTYEEFLGETLPIFTAIHSHLVSINRALGNLYYYITEAPISTFTPTGKNEIRHLTTELNRIMRGLLVATHLQAQDEWQCDLVNYLISCRSDCQRFFETIPRYYQNHRMRIVLHTPNTLDTSDSRKNEKRTHSLPLPCLPWSAGPYLDFLLTYESLASHTMAVLLWSIRLYSRWFFVPRRYLRLISPVLRV